MGWLKEKIPDNPIEYFVTLLLDMGIR
jgi:hypothetical protein